VVGGLLAQEGDLPFKGFRSPLSHFEDGRVKMQVSGARARLSEGGDMVAEAAVVEIFDEGGAIETRMEAETCRYDSAANMLHSDSAVRLERADIEITGVGMHLNAADEKVQILSHVRVVLKGSKGLGRLLPEKTK